MISGCSPGAGVGVGVSLTWVVEQWSDVDGDHAYLRGCPGHTSSTSDPLPSSAGLRPWRPPLLEWLTMVALAFHVDLSGRACHGLLGAAGRPAVCCCIPE